MNWTAVTLHKEELDRIIDASIPNKAQNHAVKGFIESSIATLMNRIADGWLDESCNRTGPNSQASAITP